MSPDANGIGLHCLPRATCPDPRRPVPVETIQLSRCLIALPDLSPRWRRTVGPAQPCGVSPDVPQGSQRPPPNRAPTAGVWRQGARPFRNLPTPEPRSGLCVVSPGDPAISGSLACRWRTAKPAASRSGPSARSPPGPLCVTSDRDAPAARPGPSRHRPARGFPNKFSLSMHGEGNARRAKGEVSAPFNPQPILITNRCLHTPAPPRVHTL